MTPNLSSRFQEWDLTPQEVNAAIASPLLLVYLQNKRAAYAAGVLENFVTAQETLDMQKELINLERQRAWLQLMDELIDEVTTAIETVQQERTQDQPEPPATFK